MAVVKVTAREIAKEIALEIAERTAVGHVLAAVDKIVHQIAAVNVVIVAEHHAYQVVQMDAILHVREVVLPHVKTVVVEDNSTCRKQYLLL